MIGLRSDAKSIQKPNGEIASIPAQTMRTHCVFACERDQPCLGFSSSDGHVGSGIVGREDISSFAP